VLDPDLISARRAALRSLDGHKLATDDQAVRFIDERGFAPLFRLADPPLPSLSDADERDGDGAWRWKEVLPEQHRCAYGKFLRGRGFFVSWRLFPAFCQTYGRPTDAADDYADALLGRLHWTVLQEITERGPIDSRVLWRALKGRFGGSRGRFEGVLSSLQASFRIMVAGGSLEGWSLHRWDLVERVAPPGVLDQLPRPEEAMLALLLQYVSNTVACTAGEAAGFLKWDLAQTRSLAARLVGEGRLSEGQIAGIAGTWLTTPELVGRPAAP
jgi:hypothetical protein